MARRLCTRCTDGRPTHSKTHVQSPGPRNALAKENHDKGVTVHLSDDTTEQADVLVGADGIWSAVRAEMYKEGAIKARSKDKFAVSMLQLARFAAGGEHAERGLSRTATRSKAADIPDTRFLLARQCWRRSRQTAGLLCAR